MKNKTMNLLVLGVFASLLLVSFASAAALTISASTPSVLPLTTGAQAFSITINGGTAGDIIHFTGLSSITENGKTIIFTLPSDVTLNGTGSQSASVSYTVPADFVFNLGKTYSPQGCSAAAFLPAIRPKARHSLMFPAPGYTMPQIEPSSPAA